MDIVVLLAGLVFALGAIEIGLTVFHPIPYAIERNMFFEADPHTGYRLKPGGVGWYEAGIPANANSNGHRDVEVSVAKPPGVFRILVIGDSFTVGANVRQEDAYPKSLERHLRATYGSNIQVVNSAVGGWDAFQYAQYFEHYGIAFEPDLILVGLFVGNDAFDATTSVDQLATAVLGRRVSREAAGQRSTKLKVLLHNHSNLARIFLARAAAPATFVRTHWEDFTPLYLALQKSRLPNHLRDSDEQRTKAQNAVGQIARIRAAAGDRIPVIVALLPDENQVNPALQRLIVDRADVTSYDFKMPQTLLVRMFGEIGLPTIDVLPAFLADHRSLYMNDSHWIPAGHELAASAIMRELMPILTRMGVSPGTDAGPGSGTPSSPA